jgi:tetratricopeptide (TPR) repeat protein
MRGEAAAIELFLGGDLPQHLLLTPLDDDISTIIVEKLKLEADRHWGIDPRRSLEFANRIVAIGQARNDQRQIALGLMARGDAMKVLGDTLQAWEALDQAGHIFQSVGDEVGWARTRIGRLYLSTMLNCVPQALNEAECAREIFIRFGERERLLRLIYQIAYVHNYLFEQTKALELYSSALEIALELGETGQQYLGIIFASMGTGYIYLGDLHQAQEYYERARLQYISHGDKFNLAGVEADLGYVAQAQGYFRRGLQLMTTSLECSEAFSPLEATKIRWNMSQSLYRGA